MRPFLLASQTDQPIQLIGHKQWNIYNVPIITEVFHGKTDYQRRLLPIILRIPFQARRLHSLPCLGFNRDNSVAALHYKIHFVGCVRPIPRRNLKAALQRLVHIVFRKRPFKFRKQPVILRKRSGRQVGQAAKDAYIHSVNLERAQVIVGGNRQARLRDPADLADYIRIPQPVQKLPTITATVTG